MRVGIVDLGGNTARLLVAELGLRGLERVLTERVVLGLGAEIEENGRISKSKLAATEATVARLRSRAYKDGCEQVEVLVTSPGRQSANRKVLEGALRRRGANRIRFISGVEEAQLAFAGAVAATTVSGPVAVCDVGGGSTEIAIGSASALPSWSRSLDIGALRVTRRHFPTKPLTGEQIDTARTGVRDALASLAPAPPTVNAALASGGTARALRKLVGATLGRDELDQALGMLRSTAPQKLARRFGLPPWRAEVLAGGTVVLAEIQILLGVPLTVAAGGLREGAALQLLAEEPAAAA